MIDVTTWRTSGDPDSAGRVHEGAWPVRDPGDGGVAFLAPSSCGFLALGDVAGLTAETTSRLSVALPSIVAWAVLGTFAGPRFVLFNLIRSGALAAGLPTEAR